MQANMTSRLRASTILAFCGLGLAACAGSREVGQNEYTSTTSQSTSLDTSPGIAGEGGISLGIGGKSAKDTEASTSGIAVNAYLWRGTLDTLSFMPLMSADPFGGVVITDWWEANTLPRERFKATVYILSRQLRSDGVKVSLFRQVEQNGQWVSVPVNTTTVGEIEDKILARARTLRPPVAER